MILIAVCGLCWSACYEIEEMIEIRGNGSGSYVQQLDMGGMLMMMQTVAGEELENAGFSRKIDTSVRMSDVLAELPEVTDEQRRLLKDGQVDLRLNIDESLMLVKVSIPFQSHKDLGLLMSGGGMESMSGALRRLMPDEGGALASPGEGEHGVEQINGVFDVEVRDGQISRKLNREKYDALMARPDFARAAQMAGAGIEIPCTTTFRLPRPAKEANHAFIHLSDDRRTVTLRYDLMEVLQSPEKFSYSIVY